MKTQKQKQPTLKDSQKEIITYTLRFRYLNRIQIQTLCGYTSKPYTISLLNDLVDKQCLHRFYIKEVAAKPAVYCLDKGAISYLRKNGIESRIVKRMYQEKNLSYIFRNHCIFLTTLYISLVALTKKTGATLHFYTQDDLHGMKYLPLPHPDSYFAITEKDQTIKRYFLDVFDDGNYLKKRIYQYVQYYKYNYWQYHTKKPFPEIILIFPTEATLKKALDFLQKKHLSDSPLFYLSTWEKIQTLGICREALLKVV